MADLTHNELADLSAGGSDDRMDWTDVEFELQWDLGMIGPELIDEAVLWQFVADGGEPWDIYRIERALFGAPLGQAA